MQFDNTVARTKDLERAGKTNSEKVIEMVHEMIKLPKMVKLDDNDKT